MIAQWMLYSVVVAICFGAAGLAGESFLRSTHRPGRWMWVFVLCGSVGLPLFNLNFTDVFARSVVSAAVDAGALVVVGALLPGQAGANSIAGFGEGILDRPLVAVWLASSLTLICLIGWTAVKLVQERRNWVPAKLGGELVVVSDDVGPAVVGIGSRAIVVPRWVLDLSEDEKRLVVLHEAEHARAGDLQLLLGGLLTAVLLPWNLAIWWQLRRLRLAIEVDCDARVLRHDTDAQAYGDFLLNVCSRARNLGAPAVALSERKSLLLRRIELLVPEARGRSVRVGVAVAMVVLGTTLACVTPAPDGMRDISAGHSLLLPSHSHSLPEYEVSIPSLSPLTSGVVSSQRNTGGCLEGFVRVRRSSGVYGTDGSRLLGTIETAEDVCIVSPSGGRLDQVPLKPWLFVPKPAGTAQGAVIKYRSWVNRDSTR